MRMEHLVEFDKYCDRCVNRDKKETEEPCIRCIAEPVNQDSRRPVYFKDAEGKGRWV